MMIATRRLCLFGVPRVLAVEPAAECPLPVQPKPLALLARLVMEPAAGAVSREHLLALFWPEMDSSHARGALRQSVFHLRQALGPGVLISTGAQSLAIAQGPLCCDATEFDAFANAAQWSDAVALYRAPFLDGFHVSAVGSEFEQWVDGVRSRFAATAHKGAWQLAEDSVRTGDVGRTGWLVRNSLAMMPDDEVALRAALRLLEAIGDRAGALAIASAFAHRLATEFGAVPDAATREILARLKHVVPDASQQPEAPTASAPTTARELPLSIGPDRSGVPRRRHDDGAVSTIRNRSPLFSASDGVRVARRPFVVTVALLALALLALPFAPRPRPLAATAQQSAYDPATITARRPITRVLFASGLRKLGATSGFAPEAARIFESALAADSSCAMCAIAAAQALDGSDPARVASLARLAARLAASASPLERLVISQRWSAIANEPRSLALAESLSVRASDDPAELLVFANSLTNDGQYTAAMGVLDRLLHSAWRAASGQSCVRCAAYSGLVTARLAADSLAAAVRAARAWSAEYPYSADAWRALASALESDGRHAEAMLADTRATRVSGGSTSSSNVNRAALFLRAEEFDSAAQLLKTAEENGVPSERESALWWHAIMLRMRGRHAEALTLVRGPLRAAGDGDIAGDEYPHTLLEAQLLLEMGSVRDAANVLRRLANDPQLADPLLPATLARRRAWVLTHLGAATAALGDTATLAALADTVQMLGRQSAFGRDQRLHHYLRALLWEARGRPDSALASARRSIVSRSVGFSRAAFEEARLQLAAGHPDAAARTLVLLRHAQLDSSNLYLSRASIHALLAQAYDAMGQLDSAAVERAAITRSATDSAAQR
jgi:DNA-binding SARP family transcriptional activator/tetratricopeptide (TPR) repeat protein